ncbi:hypothetical protein WMY93_025998 [Mugilogobius chulae]|uniref:Pentraxin family member n=1 Tax=Mugilogobius chulae TaxID=88201 RepID=A0AAW0N8N3_9GOBI
MFGKMLVFPQATNSAHVRLTTSRQNLGAVTVCMRYLTDLTRAFSFFSLATPSYQNDFLLFKNPARDEISLSVRNADIIFKGQDFQSNRWQSICGTRDAASGLVQLWVDGKPSAMKLGTYSNITGPMIIVLGQEQDSHGGAFDINQSFVGMITDVHMWDYILCPHHIDNYNQKFNFPTGNVLNWNSVEFQITGRVLIQKDQNQC